LIVFEIFPMFCPKCKQSFDEGSRRFCPTDGSRLVPDEVGAGGEQWQGGIFSNLLQKREAVAEAVKEAPRAVTPGHAAMPDDDRGDFFILEDIEPETASDPILTEPVTIAPEAVSTRPPIKKVDLRKIPAGHVELAEGDDRLAFSSADFRPDDPEAFCGRTVKGRYFIGEYFGGDESGYAFIADDKISADRKVLVRILLRGETDEELGTLLDEERVALSHFSHPNIARLIDSGQFTDGTRFLVSEYVDALSAEEVLNIHGAFDPRRAARVIRQAAYALGEAHQDGILHRDIRPANLIIAPGGGDGEHVTLMNFGVSTGEASVGTAAYRSPEVLAGRASTASSDIYSLAVVAFEMLTGTLPFPGSKANELIRAQNEGPRAASGVRNGLPRSVDTVLKKALSFKIAGRFAKARDFGDAFYAALAHVPEIQAAEFETRLPDDAGDASVIGDDRPPTEKTTADALTSSPARPAEPAWKMRSPEPPQEETARAKVIGGVILLALIGLLALGWYYVVKHPAEPELPANAGVGQNSNGTQASTIVPETEMPPQPRNISQPPNTNYYANSKQNLRGDLLHNFVGFSMYYPKDWKVNGPQASSGDDVRGKFIDISRLTPDGRMQEQMLVSYYPSKGTFNLDADRFPQLVKETNDTLKKLLPGYQMVSEREIKVNGDWRAYEVLFQAGGTSPSGEKLIVWGRRLFMPAARPGVTNGFEITMLATSLSNDVRSVDDVGVRGELAGILYSFEPSQNF
jgi:serine/threonine protein kinase